MMGCLDVFLMATVWSLSSLVKSMVGEEISSIDCGVDAEFL